MAIDLREEKERRRLSFALLCVANFGVTVLASRGETDYPSFADSLIEVNDLKVSRKWT